MAGRRQTRAETTELRHDEPWLSFRRRYLQVSTRAQASEATGEPGSKDAATREAREFLWTAALKKALSALGKKSADSSGDIKSAPWKVAIAAHLKATTTVTNPWLSAQLRMGTPEGVSRYVSELREGKRPEAEKLLSAFT